jgi:hypothetical protein
MIHLHLEPHFKFCLFQQFWHVLDHLFTYGLSVMSPILNWYRNDKFLNNSFSKENCKYVYNMQLSFDSSLCFMLILDIVAMLIKCSIIKGSTGWEQYAHMQFGVNTKKYIKFAHRILHIIEIKVKQVQSHHAPLNPCWVVIQIRYGPSFVAVKCTCGKIHCSMVLLRQEMS